MSHTLIEETSAISGNATLLGYIPNSHKYSSVVIKSILFLDGTDNVITPSTGTVLAFEISDSENLTVKTHNPWKTNTNDEWFDTISVSQLRSNQGHFFPFNGPPDFIGVTFAGVNAAVEKVKVSWWAIK